MKYVATGTRKIKDKASGESRFVNVIIPLTEETRVGAVNQAERIAKRDRVTITSVNVLRSSEVKGYTLTKAAKERKKQRGSKKKGA